MAFSLPELYRNKDNLAGFSYLFSRWLGQARAVISRILNKAYLNASTTLRDQNAGGGGVSQRLNTVLLHTFKI
jgi:hypothetical protein